MAIQTVWSRFLNGLQKWGKGSDNDNDRQKDINKIIKYITRYYIGVSYMLGLIS